MNSASAQRSPSIAAETIPPAYPAPSPQGYNPLISMWLRDSLSLVMRTGADVRVSIQITMASLVRNPLAERPKTLKPLRNRLLINLGIH